MSNFPDPKEDNNESQPAPSYTPPTDYFPQVRDTTDDNSVVKGSKNGSFRVGSNSEEE